MAFPAPAGADDARAKKPGLLSGLGGGRTWLLLAVGFSLLAMFGTFMILGRSAERTTYYVLNQAIPERTQVLPSMLTSVETADGTSPPNAMSPRDVAVQPLFAQVPLAAGDVVTSSVVGPLTRIDEGIPGNYVVTSFRVTPENAVAGKVRRGDLIDVTAVFKTQESEVAKTVLHRVLVLDVTTDPATIAQGATDSAVEDPDLAPGPESNQVRGGIPLLYVVAVTPEDAAKIALVRSRDVLVSLSGNQSDGDLDVSVDVVTDVFAVGNTAPDSSAGIDLDALSGVPDEGDTAVSGGDGSEQAAASGQ